MDMLLLLVSIITIFISTAFKSIIFYNKNVVVIKSRRCFWKFYVYFH